MTVNYPPQTDQEDAMPEQYRKIPLDQILSSTHQARKDFENKSLISLSESMKGEGLLQPVTVRFVDGHCELVSGERRVRAAKLLGWTEIEAKVIETVSEAEAAAKGLIENLQRQDLNPMEEAEGIQAMLDLKDGHWTQEQIGKVIGKSQTEISETLRLLSLSDKVKIDIRRLIITSGHASALLRLPTSELQEKVSGLIEQKGVSVKQTRALVDKMLKHQKPEKAKGGRKSLDLFAYLWPNLVADTKIKACGYWDVAHKKDKWAFTIGAETITSPKDFALWFRQMADTIEATPLPGSQETSAQGKAPPPATEEERYFFSGSARDLTPRPPAAA
jgi:ParB family chromosome partitioning protein